MLTNRVARLRGLTNASDPTQVPSAHFPAPTAAIWLDMAALVNGGRLPEHVLPSCAAAAAVAAALPFIALYLQRIQTPSAKRLEAWLPSSIGFAVRFDRYCMSSF